MLLSIVILDQKEQPITLRQMHERYILQPAFAKLTTLNETNLVSFIKLHPQFTLRISAIGAPKL